MGEVVYLRDYHLERLTRKAADIAGELVKFAKSGGPTVANADPYAGAFVPEGIDGLMYESSMGFTPYDAG